MILRGVDLEVRPGELVGVVGETGSGKSTTALAIMRLLAETMRIPRGVIDFDGIDLATVDERAMQRIRGNRLAMIFQDPRSHLNPVFPIGEQLVDVVRAHRGSRGSAEQAVALLEQVNLPNARARLNDYPHQLSGGMAQRVMIAMALAGKPDLLIADEPTSALDVTVQAQILALLRRLATEQGLAVLLISHNVAAVAQVCDRVVVMYAGNVVETATIRSLLARPGHPYTQGLLAAVPRVGAQARDMRGIPGRVANIFELRSGFCPFTTRCPAVMPRCWDEAPPPYILGADHTAACFLHDEAPL
ncbi:MAG: dipeptide/oligopeptide/nickel transporter ATP-binding protein [Thermomicrobiales bacterium]|jgi:peptide/nickel transport system ATP-binding protein|nr:dipeptide/oligopeptide/nickel transporter ATP-binding protein [Thermomicrobiales bacterium]